MMTKITIYAKIFGLRSRAVVLLYCRINLMHAPPKPKKILLQRMESKLSVTYGQRANCVGNDLQPDLRCNQNVNIIQQIKNGARTLIMRESCVGDHTLLKVVHNS